MKSLSEISAALRKKTQGHRTGTQFIAYSELEDIADAIDLHVAQSGVTWCNMCRGVHGDEEMCQSSAEPVNQRMRLAIEDLLDGLDANADPQRGGITDDQWQIRIKTARNVIDAAELSSAALRQRE